MPPSHFNLFCPFTLVLTVLYLGPNLSCYPTALAKSLAGHIKDVTSSSEGLAEGAYPGGAFEGMGGTMDLTNEMNGSLTGDVAISSSSVSGTMTRGGVASDSTVTHNSRMSGSQLLAVSDPSSTSTSRKPLITPPLALVSAPGTGWGLVDADGSEEGYGVVGLEPTMVDLLDPETLDHHR